ncbi:MAG: nitroreductase family protein [Phycisphaerae bacterium]|nr:nitroreductase family protein [Phycisphaerae bacterium]
MDIYEAIKQRYSVRAYEDKPIEDDKLQRVLEAGRVAPSGNNRQEWKFIVVRDPELRSGLAKAAEQPFVGQAPVVIVVVGTNPTRIMKCEVPADPVDCAIAIDHMTLAAVAEGLGTCWIGHFDQKASRKVLGVPETATVIELLPLGYPAGGPKGKPRKAFSEVVCYEKFS